MGRFAELNWDTSCVDWADRIRSGRSLVPTLPLNQDEVRRAVGIFNMLRLPDVPGQPPLSEAGGQWFRDILSALHGSFDPKTGVRHIREAFVLAPKKSSKTSYGAALMVTSLLLNRRPRAEFILVAPTQQVTELAFAQAVGMVEADKVLAKRLHVQGHIKRITDRKNGGTLVVKSFDPKVLTGVRPAGVLVDELHVVASAPDADRVIGQARGGLISQPEGFLFTITTQSERPPSGVFRAELMKARAVRDGRLKAPILPVLYEMPEGMDWRDQANWAAVTPNNGLSVTVERLVSDYDAAVESGEEELRRWASQHLNVEIGLALRSDRWAGADYFEAQADPTLTLDTLLARSDVATVGVDGGGLDDLLGVAVVGRDRDTRDWMLWAHAWAHPAVLERRKVIAAQLRDFERDGDLTIVETLGDDIEQVAELVAKVSATGKLAAVGLDPVGIGAIVDAMAERGIAGKIVVGIPQGWKLAGAIKTAERKLADGTLTHCGAPLMNWNVGNAKVEPRGNAIAITKQAAGSAKIDALMAAFNSIALMATNPEPAGGRSIFDRAELWN